MLYRIVRVGSLCHQHFPSINLYQYDAQDGDPVHHAAYVLPEIPLSNIELHACLWLWLPYF